MKNLSIKSFCLITLCLWVFGHSSLAQNKFPGKTWQVYANIEEAGFSVEKLAMAKLQYDSSQAAALLVIHDGKIVVSWGDNTRKYMLHSIRKSLLNSLMGIYEKRGIIALNKTLSDLNIDDISKLTPIEKQATVSDLLSARSGIYLPSAYSTKGMEKDLPLRGSHEPGTFWYYNNWDFNALGTIFEQETQTKIFEEFNRQIAQPVMMEDFNIRDGYYRHESDKSIHPAYLFRMSARDMARFGLLYLREGKWKEKQIIPSEWVKKSTQKITKDLGSFNIKGSFGYLWWISDGVLGQSMYYASGAGGHRIMVFPDSDMVIVQRVNTYEGKNVGEDETMELASLILQAKVGPSKQSSTLINYNPKPVKPDTITVPSIHLDSYLGTYTHPFLGKMIVSQGKDHLVLENGIGIFRMFPLAKNHFYPEDLETPVEFIEAEDDSQKMTINAIFGASRFLEKVIFYY